MINVLDLLFIIVVEDVLMVGMYLWYMKDILRFNQDFDVINGFDYILRIVIFCVYILCLCFLYKL